MDRRIMICMANKKKAYYDMCRSFGFDLEHVWITQVMESGESFRYKEILIGSYMEFGACMEKMECGECYSIAGGIMSGLDIGYYEHEVLVNKSGGFTLNVYCFPDESDYLRWVSTRVWF